jgi:DNA-binding CsgD family transcriptional regulator/pimeloyl-ACP methyl ester carboxylesterase
MPRHVARDLPHPCRGYARWVSHDRSPGTPQARFTRTVDGVSIAYAVSGTGPPLVLMPAMPLGNFTGEWQVPIHRDAYQRLGRHVQLIQYDSRGSGRSQRDVSDLSAEATQRDLDAVVSAAGLERFALMGMYLCTAHALAYALRHPDRVSHLILFGGSARGWDSMGATETQALLSLIDHDWDTFVSAAMHAWLGWSAGETDGRLQTESARTSTTPAVTRQLLQAASGVDLTDQVPKVQAPVLVFHQNGARQVALEVSRQLAAAVPDGRLVVFEGAAASLFIDAFDLVLAELLRFLGLDPADGARRPTTRPTDAWALYPLPRPTDARPVPPLSPLSPRETQVLRILAGGETNAEIARQLGLSVNTVERHIANIYRKIDARGRADATAYAIRGGIA